MPWYVQLKGELFGPYDDAQFKSLATESRISPDTQVSQSREGPWVSASRVKGLFAGIALAQATSMAAASDQPNSGATGAALLDMHAQAVEQLETISSTLSQIVARVDGGGNGVAAGRNGATMQYKVLTQKDKWFSGKFDPEKLEGAINSYAAQGWRVCGVATASFPGFGGNREEMVVVMERDS